MPSLEDQIRQRAYELWEAHGCPEGDSDQFWYMAEREVMATDAPAASDAPQPATRKAATASAGTSTAKKARSPAKAAKEGGKSADASATRTRAKAGESAAKKSAGTGARTASRGKKPARGNPPSTTGET